MKLLAVRAARDMLWRHYDLIPDDCPYFTTWIDRLDFLRGASRYCDDVVSMALFFYSHTVEPRGTDVLRDVGISYRPFNDPRNQIGERPNREPV